MRRFPTSAAYFSCLMFCTLVSVVLMQGRPAVVNFHKPPRCELLSPVEIDINNRQSCVAPPIGNIEFGTEPLSAPDILQWILYNDGSNIKIMSEPPRSTYITFEDKSAKYYIDYALIKFGTNQIDGSEHIISGAAYAGELQIFCLPLYPGGEIQALAFMIQERRFATINKHWDTILNRVSYVQEYRLTTNVDVPPQHFKDLLRKDKSSNPHLDADEILSVAFRYKGTSTYPPCIDNVIWRVYPRSIQVATRQLTAIRHVHTIDGTLMSAIHPSLKQNNNKQCLLRY